MANALTATPAPCAILRVPRVVQMTGVSRSTLWRLEREGDFPARVRLTGRTIGWREADVRAWIETRESVGA